MTNGHQNTPVKLGPTALEKTTTIKLLTGITEEFYGSAEVCGVDVRKSPYPQFIGRVHHMDGALIKSRATKMSSKDLEAPDRHVGWHRS
jgi:hypothetical protein